MRLTRILKNGVAVAVAVIAVNTLQAQPATPTPNQSGDQVNNSSTAIGNNQSGTTTQNGTPTGTAAQNGTSQGQPGAPNSTPNQSGDPVNNSSTAIGNSQSGTTTQNGTTADNTTGENNTEKTSHRAKEFLKNAEQANSAEIALSQVAQSRAQNSDVKQLAQMMVTDHQACNQKVQAIAQAHGLVFDQSLDWINQHEVNRLQKADEATFDKDYTKVMLKDHVKAIKMFQKAADDINEPDVKEFAANTLPTLRTHLRHAEDAARAIGLDDSTVNSIVKDVPQGGTD
jgi:putative membrane protein